MYFIRFLIAIIFHQILIILLDCGMMEWRARNAEDFQYRVSEGWSVSVNGRSSLTANSWAVTLDTKGGNTD